MSRNVGAQLAGDGICAAPQTAPHSWHIWWPASVPLGTKALVLDRLLPDPNCLLPSELLNRNDRSVCSFLTDLASENLADTA